MFATICCRYHSSYINFWWYNVYMYWHHNRFLPLCISIETHNLCDIKNHIHLPPLIMRDLYTSYIFFIVYIHVSVMKSSTVCIVKYRYMHNVLGSSFSSFPYTGYSSLWRTVTKYTVTIKWKILNSHWIICHINVLVLNDMVSVCESSEVDQVKPIEKEVCHTNTWWTDNSFITFI